MFADLPGLEDVKALLIKNISANRVPHAQLLAGPYGALTLPLALAYATYLHCENKQPTDACGQCAACRQSHKHSHPDTWFMFPQVGMKSDEEGDKMRNDLRIRWRSFLTQKPFGKPEDWLIHSKADDKPTSIARDQSRELMQALQVKPFMSRYKAVVCWQPEQMNPAVFNSLLKIIEEPPMGTVFLLASDRAEELPSTLHSRLIEVPVPLLEDKTIEQYLKQQNIAEALISPAVHLAAGDLQEALNLAEDGQLPLVQPFLDWMRSCFRRDYSRLTTLAEEFHQMDRLRQQLLLRYQLSMLRESLICWSKVDALSRLKSEEREAASALSAVLTLSGIETLHQLISAAMNQLVRNGSAKMIFLSLSLRCADLLNP